MAWQDNKYKGVSLKTFHMTSEERKALSKFCQTPDTTTAEKNELVLKFWEKLGERLGFDVFSISRLNGITFDAKAT